MLQCFDYNSIALDYWYTYEEEVTLILIEINICFIVYRSFKVAPTFAAFQQTPARILACLWHYAYQMTLLSPPIFILNITVQMCWLLCFDMLVFVPITAKYGWGEIWANIIKHYQLLHNKSRLTLTSLNKTHHLARIIIYCCIIDGIMLEGAGRVAIVLSIVDDEIYSTRRHPQPRGRWQWYQMLVTTPTPTNIELIVEW